MSFLEQLSQIRTLRGAWESVAANRGMAGIDRETIADFSQGLEERLRRLADEIRSGGYRPLPVLRIRPAFLAASDRALVVPAVRDRVVQRAVADLLTPEVDPTLSPACRAFRKGSSARAAADDVGRWIEAGIAWVLRADVKSFFDSIRPQILRSKLAPFVDPEGLRFLERIVRCRIFDREETREMVVGIAQGSPLSPLLGNLYLSELDAGILAEHPHYLRYCDDMIVLAPQEAEVCAAEELLGRLLEPLGLSLNADKTRRCRAEDGFTFLGFHFGPAGRGPAVRAVEALRCRLAELSAGDELDLDELDAVYRGWSGYFGHHPECWTGSAAGILALLRADGVPEPESLARRLVAARWGLAETPGPPLALALASAWAERGHPEQSWLELAAACGGSKRDAAEAPEWARVLGVGSERLGELARRLVGTPAERLATLTEGLAELGRYELASRLAAAAGAYVAGPATEAAAEASDPAAGADLPLLMRWFQGRNGAHAVESVNRAGHRSFIPVHRSLSEEDWQAHLRGEKTLALPLVRRGDTAFLGVLDVDIERRQLDQRLGVADEMLGRALGTALKLRAELAGRGAAGLLEASGWKGYHLWLRLEEPVPVPRLRRWLLDVVRAIGPLPEGVRVEELPNRDRIRPDQIGPVVKLPLGVHSKTGRRCHLLDDHGQPVEDPWDLLRSVPWVPPRVVLEPGGDAARDGGEPPAAPELGPRAQKILESCRVLGYLAKKAKDTAYLTHRERWSLLCVLGHLGEEGSEALHAIIGHTYNYRREVTERHLGRRPPSPISCPKLRELHPEAAALGACTCQFSVRGKAYPTPLLYALKPAQIPAFRKPPPSRREAEEVEGPPGTLLGDAEVKVRKIAELKRHRRGIDRSIERLRGELGVLFEQAGCEELQLPVGLLRRVRVDAGEGWDFVIEV